MNISIAKYKKTFSGHTIPAALESLLKFQNRVGYENYSQAITLQDDDKSGLVQGWSDDPLFLAALVPFARANGSGSFYALWNNNESSNLASWPVVVFGDEGGEWIVAENVISLLQICACDTEPMVDHDSAIFYKSEDDYEASEYITEYKAWLKSSLQVEPIETPDQIVESAQANLQESFNEWKQPFLAHWSNS